LRAGAGQLVDQTFDAIEPFLFGLSISRHARQYRVIAFRCPSAPLGDFDWA
jgi:hypothetical protein